MPCVERGKPLSVALESQHALVALLAVALTK